MKYTTEDGGRLNTYAVEPKMYRAEPMTPGQKRNYIIAAVASTTLIIALMLLAASLA